MDSSSLNAILGQSEEWNADVSLFVEGVTILARHWRGEEGIKEINSRIASNLENGLPIHESLIEAYQHVRAQVI